MNYYDRFKLTHDIDKEAHPDTEIVRFMGRDLPLGLIRKTYERFEERLYTSFIYWDDVIQYTSLGLIDVLYEKYKIDNDLPIKSFLERDFNITYGYDFVIKHMENYDISKEIIDEVFKTNYKEILKRSPITKNGKGLLRLRNICNMMYFVFAHEVDTSGILDTLQNVVPIDHVCGTKALYNNGITEEIFLKEHLSYNIKTKIDIYVAQDGGAYIDYAINNDVHDTIIIAPDTHNGISPGAQLIYLDTEGSAPNECNIHFISEGL